MFLCELFVWTVMVWNERGMFQTLLPAANLLQLVEVRDACCDFLQSQLHPSNCLGIRAFADLHACQELLHYSQSYIEQHFRCHGRFVQCAVLRVCFSSPRHRLGAVTLCVFVCLRIETKLVYPCRGTKATCFETKLVCP